MGAAGVVAGGRGAAGVVAAGVVGRGVVAGGGVAGALPAAPTGVGVGVGVIGVETDPAAPPPTGGVTVTSRVRLAGILSEAQATTNRPADRRENRFARVRDMSESR